MKVELTSISELAKRSWISKDTERFLSAANVKTVSDLGYGNPYYLKWLAMPGINLTVSNDILSAFARLDEQAALDDEGYKSLLFDQLPVDLQTRLQLNFDIDCSSFDVVQEYVERTGLTVEQLHNTAVTGVYGLMRLVAGFGLAENVAFRRFILTYLGDEIFVMSPDIYAKVHEIYAHRRGVLNDNETVLRWDEIRAFYLDYRLRGDLLEVLDCYKKDEGIVQRLDLDLDTLVSLFKKPMEVFDQRFDVTLSDSEKDDAIALLDVIQDECATILNRLVDKQLYD